MTIIRTKPYTTKNGIVQIKPSFELLEELDENQQGFCLACGEIQDEVEPDARRYVCDCCDAPKVFGATELALMGLAF